MIGIDYFGLAIQCRDTDFVETAVEVQRRSHYCLDPQDQRDEQSSHAARPLGLVQYVALAWSGLAVSLHLGLAE